MLRVKKVGILSFALFNMILSAIIGLIQGIFIVVAGESMIGGLLGSFGLLIIIINPILVGALGFVMGAVMGLVVNLVFKSIGGLQVDIAEEEEPAHHMHHPPAHEMHHTEHHHAVPQHHAAPAHHPEHHQAAPQHHQQYQGYQR